MRKTPQSACQALFFVFSCFFSNPTLAHPLSGGSTGQRDSAHVAQGGLLGRWYHDDDHHSVKLFRRQSTGNGTTPAVGSNAWNALYPGYGTPDPTQMPALWQQKLAEVEAAGLIPNITQTNAGVYPKGVNAASPEICNAAVQCQAPGDIWNAPDGMLGVSFDDGPTTFSPPLYDFLKSQRQQATHFYIGINIKTNPTVFQQAYNNGDEIACHTWSHPWMTSLTNAQIVAELGWTQQLISDMSGGRLPRYWRPPMGDSDNRVRAIAQNVFGLQQVDWNQDTADWTIGLNEITVAGIEAALTKFINLPKSPGLIILEHELYAGTVQAFIDMYPQMLAKGWITKSIGQLFDVPLYQNSQDDNSTTPVYEQNLIANATGTVSGLIPTGSSFAPTSTTGTSGTPPTNAVAAAQSSKSSTSGARTKHLPWSELPLASMSVVAVTLIGVAHFAIFA